MWGNDTDTNAARSGQIMGTSLGFNSFPDRAKAAFFKILESNYIRELASEVSKMPGKNQVGSLWGYLWNISNYTQIIGNPV
jgi:hypothetical protein